MKRLRMLLLLVVALLVTGITGMVHANSAQAFECDRIANNGIHSRLDLASAVARYPSFGRAIAQKTGQLRFSAKNYRLARQISYTGSYTNTCIRHGDHALVSYPDSGTILVWQVNNTRTGKHTFVKVSCGNMVMRIRIPRAVTVRLHVRQKITVYKIKSAKASATKTASDTATDTATASQTCADGSTASASATATASASAKATAKASAFAEATAAATASTRARALALARAGLKASVSATASAQAQATASAHAKAHAEAEAQASVNLVCNVPPTVQIFNGPQHVYVTDTVRICAQATDGDGDNLNVTFDARLGTVSPLLGASDGVTPPSYCITYTAPSAPTTATTQTDCTSSTCEVVKVTVTDGHNNTSTDSVMFPIVTDPNL